MDLNQLHWAWQTLIAALLVTGGLFTLIGAIGMLRFKDFYMRLHAPTKATTLGVGGVLIASALYFTVRGPGFSVHEFLITLFLFLAAPVAAHLLAKAALRLRLAGGVKDE